MFESLKIIDDVRLNFSEEGLFALNLTLAFIMFGVALEIKPRHFREVFVEKRAPIVGIISQFVLLPAVTTLLIFLMRGILTPSIAMGMILVACCPGGNISNFISSLAKGNAALSVTLTAIATIGAIVLTPLNFSFWGGVYTNFISHIDSATLLRPLEINPIRMFETVFVLLGIPLVLGMAFNHYFPRTTDRILKPIKALSIAFFVSIVVLAFQKNVDYFLSYIHYIFIIVLIHNALALISGYTFASSLGVGYADRRSITIETGIQNSGLALVLLFNPKIFPMDIQNGGMAFIAAWWGIWHILAGLGIAWFWSRRKP